MSPRDSLVGRIEELSLWAGQSVGLVHEVLPAAEIVRRTLAEAEATLAALAAIAASAASAPGAPATPVAPAGAAETPP